MPRSSDASQTLAGLEALRPHDHACSVHDDDETALSIAARFMRIGFERHERCIYVVSDGAENRILEAMRHRDVDVAGAMASNALVLAPHLQVYFRQGNFDPASTIALWRDATRQALASGFAALRIVAGLHWVLDGAPDTSRWIEYESMLTPALAGLDCLALCQCERRRFEADQVLAVLRSHPWVVCCGSAFKNMYYVPRCRHDHCDGPERELERQLTHLHEREQVETTLRRQGSELRGVNDRVGMLLDGMTDEFFGIDSEWRYTYFNRHAEGRLRLLGKDPAALLGMTLWEAFPDTTAAGVYRRVMRDRVPAIHEEYCAPLGEWIENRIFPCRDGGVAILCRPITHLKQAEEDLRRSEANLAEGQRISHTGSWSWNAVTDALFWSVEHCRIFGLDPEAGPPSPEDAFRRLHPDDRAYVEDTFRSAVRDRRSFDVDFRVVRPDGVVRHVQSIGHPVLGATGELAEFVGTVIDVTERRDAEEALRTTQAELARFSRAITIGQLTASIAHEVNQPLAAVVMNGHACLRWLEGPVPNLVEVRDGLNRIVMDSNRASDVIARIRALIERTDARKERFDLNRAIQEVASLLKGEFTANDVLLRMDLDRDLVPILGDRIQLQQVVLNLLMNGVDSMRQIGRARELHISSEALGDHVRVRVRDSGVGIDSRNRERIFQPFYSTKLRGMGIGLAISRSIIEAHDGRLEVGPDAGPGAIVQFSVPVSDGRSE